MILLNKEFEVLEEFTNDYSLRLTGSFIAKKRGLNQKTVSTYLNALEKESFLKSETEGKNRLYSLNLEDNKTALRLISAIESLKAISFYKKTPLIKQVISEIKISGTAIVFGSYAKGTAKKGSDLDLVIIGSSDESSIRKAEDVYNIEINAKVFSKADFKNSLKSIFLQEVIKNHVLLQEGDFFIGEIISK